jgi:hypothetical protein
LANEAELGICDDILALPADAFGREAHLEDIPRKSDLQSCLESRQGDMRIEENQMSDEQL